MKDQDAHTKPWQKIILAVGNSKGLRNHELSPFHSQRDHSDGDHDDVQVHKDL